MNLELYNRLMVGTKLYNPTAIDLHDIKELRQLGFFVSSYVKNPNDVSYFLTFEDIKHNFVQFDNYEKINSLNTQIIILQGSNPINLKLSFDDLKTLVKTNYEAEFNITLDHNFVTSIKRSWVTHLYPRYLIAWFMVDYLNYSLINVGRIMGGRNHATIINIKKQLPAILASEPKMKIVFENITTILKNGYTK